MPKYRKKLVTHQRIPIHLHEKMVELAAKNNRMIYEEYQDAIEKHIANQTQEILAADSRLEQYIHERLTKLENRLFAMLGRMMMDNGINLMGNLIIWEKAFQKKRDLVYEELRKQAAQYVSKPYRNQE